ncbi:MAG: cell division protein FtsQ/DivIB [Candidatus Gastranaerophilaceae bacterium]
MTNSELGNTDNKQQQTEQDEYTLAKSSAKHRKTERKIRKRRHKVNRLKKFLRLVLIILLAYLGYQLYMLSGWYLPQDAFKKADSSVVEIANNKIIPTFVINRALKDIPVSKQPIFFMSVKPIKKEIFKIPVIKNVYVRRYGFPARIQIIVRERVPVAVIKTDLKNNPVAFFTSDGVLVTNKQYMSLPTDKSILTILSNSQDVKKNWDIKRVQYIEKIVKDVELYSDEKVEYVDMKNPNDVYIKIQTTSIRLGALDSTVFERIKRIYTILPQITEVDSHIKYIDLSWDKVNYLKLNKSKK